ncbi:MAG: DUF2085 domain-containing protein [Anaerolineae bacterium]|jgi:uncharacterized membrane protein|nr:DUF2085 domain-containing protein [Anaerolineae bacterium]
MNKLQPAFWKWTGVTLAVAALLAFVILTPPPLLRKIDYIGAAVCHRMPTHSFFVDGHQLPVCQRCTGTFTGALTGLLFHWGILRRRRYQRFPALWMWGVLAACFAFWGLDGVNSMTTDQFGVSILGYAPQPWLRLLTGTLMGMSMSVVLVPAFNLTLWKDGVDEHPLTDWKDLLLLILVELAQAALIYTLEPWLLYPIALYTTVGVTAMFILLGAMVWVMALGYDQRYASWRQAWLPFLWGVAFAALVIGGMDAVRLYILGSIDRIPGVM